MKESKKIIGKLAVFLLLVVIAAVLPACSATNKNEEGEKLKIVTTLFPAYDFAKQIAGDKAEVSLLLDPGVEAHEYDPTPADIIEINKSDIFIYMGDNMEHWAASIIDSLESPNVTVLDASSGVEFIKSSEHDENESGQTKANEEADAHEYDPHIWTSPKNAMIMVNTILETVVKADSENESYYRQNAANYIEQLKELDEEFRELAANAKYKTIYFGGRFAFIYFVQEYGFGYMAAFDSCSSETEPSAKLVTKIVDAMKASGSKVVYYEELTDNKTAKAIAQEVGGTTKLLHSCHNVSNKDFMAGETYVSLMKRNVENLKEGLGEVSKP